MKVGGGESGEEAIYLFYVDFIRRRKNLSQIFATTMSGAFLSLDCLALVSKVSYQLFSSS